MTKPKLLWCKAQLQVAAFIVCGLFLLHVSSTVEAASQKPSPKAASDGQAKKPARHSGRQVLTAPEFGPADVIEDGVPGLRGHASFYGRGFQGRKTATGDRFDVQQFTAASNRFPLGTMLAVRRMDNDRCAIVKVNDRMHPKHRKRIIDVSLGVAFSLADAEVRCRLKKGSPDRSSASCRAAFEREPESECVSCGQLPKLPDFLPSFDG